MARDATITFEQVATAADSIKAQGGKPTARAVRDVLGTGSMATVLKFLQQWQGTQERQSQAVDDTLDPAIGRAIRDTIAAKVRQATADATARLADLQAEAAGLITENERQAGEIEARAAEIAALQERHAALAGRIEQLQTDGARTADNLLGERQAAEAARVALARSELRLEALPRLEADLVALRDDLARERAARIAAEQMAAVTAADLKGAERRAVEAEGREQAALARAGESERQAQGTARELSSANLAVQAGQARLESAARELDDARRQTKAARETAQAASEEAAELRGRLAATAPKGEAKPAKAAAPRKTGD